MLSHLVIRLVTIVYVKFFYNRGYLQLIPCTISSHMLTLSIHLGGLNLRVEGSMHFVVDIDQKSGVQKSETLMSFFYHSNSRSNSEISDFSLIIIFTIVYVICMILPHFSICLFIASTYFERKCLFILLPHCISYINVSGLANSFFFFLLVYYCSVFLFNSEINSGSKW